MYCKICGDTKNVKYYNRFGYFACKYCAKGTPAKVNKETFKKVYFGNEPVLNSILNEFYEDYKFSKHNLQEYIEKTISNY